MASPSAHGLVGGRCAVQLEGADDDRVAAVDAERAGAWGRRGSHGGVDDVDVPGLVGKESEAAQPGDARGEDVVAAGVGEDDHAVAGEAGVEDQRGCRGVVARLGGHEQLLRACLAPPAAPDARGAAGRRQAIDEDRNRLAIERTPGDASPRPSSLKRVAPYASCAAALTAATTASVNVCVRTRSRVSVSLPTASSIAFAASVNASVLLASL